MSARSHRNVARAALTSEGAMMKRPAKHLELTGIGHKRLLLAGIVACAALPSSALAQSNSSPYTTGYRWDADRRIMGIISPDPDDAGPLPFPAVRYTYDADGLLIKTEKGSLSAWAAETVLPANWVG